MEEKTPKTLERGDSLSRQNKDVRCPMCGNYTVEHVIFEFSLLKLQKFQTFRLQWYNGAGISFFYHCLNPDCNLTYLRVIR